MKGKSLAILTTVHALGGPTRKVVGQVASSVCFNNCSGHGHCVDYSCECDVGYEGDDCSFCYFEGDMVQPHLSAGDVNLTSTNFRDTLLEAGTILAVASSRSCHRCIGLEQEYQAAASALQGTRVLLGRIDADVERTLLDVIMSGDDAATQHLPSIALCTAEQISKKALIYEGPHVWQSIVEFVKKQMQPPAKKLRSVAEVEAFVARPHFHDASASMSTPVTVVAFFSDGGKMEDEMDDFMEAAIILKPRADLYFGTVDDEATCEHFRREGWIMGAAEAVLTRPGQTRARSLSLWALLDDNMSVVDWIVRESVPLVGHLTNANFARYERTRLPMLIMFLELPDSFNSAAVARTRIGGKSGGVLNDNLVEELGEVATEHRGRISCLYADGIAFADSMKTLGLFGSRGRLPQVGFNSVRTGMDHPQVQFPEEFPINRETLLQFATAFLSGQLQTSMDTQNAMVAFRPFSTYNAVTRRDKIGHSPEIRGVSEQLKIHDAVTQVTRDTFAETVIDSDKDVLLMFHSQECERCSSFIPYYKRLGERFRDLGISSALVVAMDVTNENPPSQQAAITLPSLPAILLLPGDEKGPPFRFYSGLGKVGPLMRWFQKHSSTPFDLPVLPHLSETEKPLFREQVTEREGRLQTTRAKMTS